jgi:hypothetical protein
MSRCVKVTLDVSCHPALSGRASLKSNWRNSCSYVSVLPVQFPRLSLGPSRPESRRRQVEMIVYAPPRRSCSASSARPACRRTSSGRCRRPARPSFAFPPRSAGLGTARAGTHRRRRRKCVCCASCRSGCGRWRCRREPICRQSCRHPEVQLCSGRTSRRAACGCLPRSRPMWEHVCECIVLCMEL